MLCGSRAPHALLSRKGDKTPSVKVSSKLIYAWCSPDMLSLMFNHVKHMPPRRSQRGLHLNHCKWHCQKCDGGGGGRVFRSQSSCSSIVSQYDDFTRR